MTSLRIGWASPWNERSAIAHSAAEVAFELAKLGHSITVLRTELGEALAAPSRPAPGPVIAIGELSSQELRESFDVVAVHIGNHFDFHGGALPYFDEVGMVGIFHDLLLAHLAWPALGGDERAMRRLVTRLYGGNAWPRDEGFFDDLGMVARRRPMLEWLATRTVGAVAHAEHYAARLRGACEGPVIVIPLAFTPPASPPRPPPRHGLTLGMVGHANANKRIDQLVLAIAASGRLRNSCNIRIIGEAEPHQRARISFIARAAGVAPPAFVGYVKDEDLAAQLRDVDVISCLRNPILEGASASVISGLASGRPTLVTKHGCYAELPSDTALFCDPDHEARDVVRHLEALLDSPDRGAALADRAGRVAADRHSPVAYAKQLVSLLEEVAAREPAAKASFTRLLQRRRDTYEEPRPAPVTEQLTPSAKLRLRVRLLKTATVVIIGRKRRGLGLGAIMLIGLRVFRRDGLRGVKFVLARLAAPAVEPAADQTTAERGPWLRAEHQLVASLQGFGLPDDDPSIDRARVVLYGLRGSSDGAARTD